MNKLRLASFVLLSICTVAPRAAAPGLVGKDAPDFALKSADGTNLRLSEFRGQVVLINFWARWAGDCRQEIPALQRIDNMYRHAGLVVLGVSVDLDVRRGREFADAMKIAYPVLFDTSPEVGQDYHLEKMPATYLVDRSGVVRFANVGFKRGDENTYLDHIRALLRE